MAVPPRGPSGGFYFSRREDGQHGNADAGTDVKRAGVDADKDLIVSDDSHQVGDGGIGDGKDWAIYSVYKSGGKYFLFLRKWCDADVDVSFGSE